MQADLSQYSNSWYKPGANAVVRFCWYYVNILFFINPLNPFSGVKVILLRLFGAKLGKGIVIKPSVNIKYPWNLRIGNYVWIGEHVWIDNLTKITIGNNVCISQGAMLLTGNHNYKKITFDLVVRTIVLEDGCWIGAHAIVCPGVVCHRNAILAVNSVATHNLDENMIYQGNPADSIRQRFIDALK